MGGDYTTSFDSEFTTRVVVGLGGPATIVVDDTVFVEDTGDAERNERVAREAVTAHMDRLGIVDQTKTLT